MPAAEEVAKIGLFTVTQGDNGCIRFTGDPRTGDANYVDCFASFFQCSDLCLGGIRQLGAGSEISCGCSSDGVFTCTATPVQEMTWSRIKDTF